MIGATRTPLLSKIAVCAVSLACALALATAAVAGAAAVAVGSEPTVTYQKESYADYQHQLASGQVKSVTVNKRVRSVRVTLKDGRFVLARYAPHEEPKVLAALAAKGVPVTILKSEAARKPAAKKPAHKLRYIAGGILVVVVIVVGAVLLIDRQRKASADKASAGAPPPGAEHGGDAPPPDG